MILDSIPRLIEETWFLTPGMFQKVKVPSPPY